jgi:hypothetical protein
MKNNNNGGGQKQKCQPALKLLGVHYSFHAAPHFSFSDF